MRPHLFQLLDAQCGFNPLREHQETAVFQRFFVFLLKTKALQTPILYNSSTFFRFFTPFSIILDPNRGLWLVAAEIEPLRFGYPATIAPEADLQFNPHEGYTPGPQKQHRYDDTLHSAHTQR